MLKTPASFPFPGSFALHVDTGQPQLVRIIAWADVQSGKPTSVLVSYPLRLGASGNTQLPVAALINGSPLTAEERMELRVLEEHLSGKKRPRKLDLAREAELRTRDVNAVAMTRLIDEGVRRKLINADAGRLAVAA